MKVAVIVNDMGEINIDAELVKMGNSLSHREERLVEMTNGCICCTLREDLIEEVGKLAREGRFDYLLIESSGISEPLPVAQTFSFLDEKGVPLLADVSRLDTLVTVVDAVNFPRDFGSADTVYTRQMNDDPEDSRAIVNLLTDQVEFANVILLSKTDLVSEDQTEELVAILSRLNPEAKIYRIQNGTIELSKIMNTGLYEEEAFSGTSAWIEELENEHVPESESYGISSFVFRDKRPFHPDRFWEYISEKWPSSIIRSKGLFYLGSRFDQALSWSQAGGSLKAEPIGVWWASMPYQNRIAYQSYIENKDVIESRWDKRFGDRMNELVFIGQYPDKDQIRSELESCLMTGDEIEQMTKVKITDTWPI